MLGVALELRRRGYEVTFATNEHYAGLAARHGLPFEPLGTEADFEACIRDPALWQPRKALPHVFRCLQSSLRRQYEIHEAAAARGPTAGVTNVFGFGALLAREKLGVPVVTLHLQPAVLWSDHVPPSLPGMFGPRWLRSFLYSMAERFVVDPVFCPFLNAWREELGLAPVRQVMRWWHSPGGVLAMFPDWYAAAQPDWPEPLVQTDFPLWNDRADQRLDDEVEAFLQAGPPPVVFTPGSTNVHGGTFFDAAVYACRTLGRRGVLLTEFPEQLPNDLPDGVTSFRYVPLDLLLNRSAAFVHHGGVGSTSQALLAGIPQVLMPLAHDQFDNAERVRRLGVGDSLPAPRFRGPRLVEKLQPLLESRRVARRCQEIAKRLQARSGISRTADGVEQLVGAVRPVPAPGVDSSSGNIVTDDGKEECWNCGARSWCSDHFLPCTGNVMRVCPECLETLTKPSSPIPERTNRCEP